jgi:uncharacterized protein YsxB (DUF464 family)
MIRITFEKAGGLYTGFEVSGHAGYAPEGRDIVCAAVSSAVQMAANAITEIEGCAADVAADAENGFLSLRLKDRGSPACQTVLRALILHMRALAEDFEETIAVYDLEV